jgi:uncharacterized damage-inducible protein DinB
MTGTISLLFVSLVAVPLSLFAQSSDVAPARASAPTPANPISVSQAKVYTMLSGVVIAAAEKMPEENYSFRPTDSVRSFGQLVGHLADSQYYFCSSVSDESKPSGSVEKTKTSKADLVSALKEAVAYCGRAYASMTDAKGSEMTKVMNMDMAKLAALGVNTAHDYEHYGNMVTYMRIKGIVPPTSEKSPGATK